MTEEVVVLDSRKNRFDKYLCEAIRILNREGYVVNPELKREIIMIRYQHGEADGKRIERYELILRTGLVIEAKKYQWLSTDGKPVGDQLTNTSIYMVNEQ
jgi:ubiquinone/menaquinone biosynthesis C-methylase UbiE